MHHPLFHRMSAATNSHVPAICQQQSNTNTARSFGAVHLVDWQMIVAPIKDKFCIFPEPGLAKSLLAHKICGKKIAHRYYPQKEDHTHNMVCSTYHKTCSDLSIVQNYSSPYHSVTCNNEKRVTQVEPQLPTFSSCAFHHHFCK